MALFYVAADGESGSLEQAIREAEALIKSLKDPDCRARLIADMPECVAAVDVWRPLVAIRADGTGGQIGLSAVECDTNTGVH